MRFKTDDNGSIAPECTEAQPCGCPPIPTIGLVKKKAATRSERQIGLIRLVMKVRVRHIAGDMLVWSKVCSVFNVSKATYLDERLESAPLARCRASQRRSLH
jgi:hypothetical protein